MIRTSSTAVLTDYKNVTSRRPGRAPIDLLLCVALLLLLVIGVVFVASASMTIGEQQYRDPFHFIARHLVYLLAGLVLAAAVAMGSPERLRNAAPVLLVVGLVLLAVVLIPGLGHMVNGSRRWLGFGAFNMQPSELMKLFLVIYMAAFLARNGDAVRTELRGFVKPLLLLGAVAALLMFEPDFGSTAVIACTVVGMMFLAGMRLWPFAVLVGAGGAAMALLAVMAPYRMARLTSFMDPWSDPFASGFQLTQALIAFGHGGWFGAGLGGSIQKLSYLPEAHTDFVFAVLAEELGLLGTLGVIALFGIVVARAFAIGWRAERLGNAFQAYLAYGIALWLGLQAAINIGVNMGVLPTKGLTLPLLSYGGSSLVVTLVACALLLRVDYETRTGIRGARR
jgi:cell division protein FtsW